MLLDNSLQAPIAAKQPHVLSIHGDERIDNYFWMRDSNDPNVIAYLQAENAYTESVMQDTNELQAKLYEEMLSYIQETDLSVPYRKGDYYYYSRTEEGKAYPIYCRKYSSLAAPEEVLLDQNELSRGYEYFRLGVFKVSPNQQILAYSIDTTGAETYTLFFLDLQSKQLYSESISDTYYSLAWGNDSKTVFYTQIDSLTRPYKLLRHTLGTTVENDVLIHHEQDEAYFLSISKTRSEAYILMQLESKVTSEVHYLDANYPERNFNAIQPRTQGMEYKVEHHGDYFYILTNEQALNFKLIKTPVQSPTKENWQTVIPHREDVLLSSVSAFAEHLVIQERQEGLSKVRVRKLSTGDEHWLTFPEPTYTISQGDNPEFNTNIWRFSYTSLVTPESIFDYNLDTQERKLKKETPVKGYDKNQYSSDRIMATATDGAKIPISIVYKQGTEKNSSNPLLLIGYGAYGMSYPAAFSSNRISLLERGIVIAIAHIRGGSEMGRNWYENGKFLHKKNTFTDFISCAEHLISEKWTSPEHLAISGGSAGGLLMGAVTNMRPDLFKTVVAHVPFVDVLNTMLDAAIPLTVLEWEEWGNPNDKTYYDYMKSYSPYDNVEAKNYPNILITAGLNDPRVKYWEPAKLTAKLRELKTDNNILLLKTNMGAGHGGASGRYERLKEIALEYAFLLKCCGINC